MPFSSKIGCLNTALGGTFELTLPWQNPPSGMIMSDWIMRQNIFGWSLGAEMRCIGFTRTGYIAVHHLIKLLRANDATYRRLVSFAKLMTYALDDIRTSWSRDGLRRASLADLKAFEQRIADWLKSFQGVRIHLVPCAIIEGAAQSFSIGPVRFVHIDHFDPTDYGIEKWEIASAPLVQCMAQHDAKWIGIVEVQDCEPTRSEEFADLIIDLALGSLQAVLPDYDARNMARMTGRAMAPLRGSLVLDNEGRWTVGRRLLHPGFLLTAEHFDGLIKRASCDLQAMGRRIEVFRTGTTELPGLEQAWSDAALWFHEGFSEPLDTVAVTKLETAIENLFAAGNPSESKARLLLAFKHLLRMEKTSILDMTVPISVDQFVKSVVTARSRILHGTWSTLSGPDLGVERRDVVKLARTLLICYARVLDAYASSSEKRSDSIKALLTWIELR
jgi:hypothetical protein